jgi:glycosyltransferase involved in cell wall biosynthesis
MNKKNEPLVSVIVPAYNAERYIGITLEAIVSQTYSNWELIIVCNSPTDNTEKIVEGFCDAHADRRIQIIRNPVTVPAPENWNIGLRAARGELLKMVCADDVPTADCLERQVNALQNNPAAILAAGAKVIINSKGKPLFKRVAITTKGLHSGKQMIKQCAMSGSNIIGDPVCVTWRRWATDQAGLFDPSFIYCTDMELWMRLLALGDLYYDTDPVGFYRIHPSAAAIDLSSKAADDILRAAKQQVERGAIELSQAELKIALLVAHWKAFLRQLIYKCLG